MKSWYLSSFLVVLSLILVFVLAPASILLQPLTSNIAFASANISNLTRIVPPGALCPNTTFNVTVNWTINATGVNSLVLTDYAPAGWSLSGNNSWSQPNSSNYSIVGGRIEIIWTLSPNVSDKFSAVYQATVPANATPGNYSFVNGTLDYYVNITGPCTDTIADSTVTVTAYSLTVTSDGCCPIDVSGAVNDTIPAGGNATYPDLACGAVVTLNATATGNCTFNNWKVDGSPVGGNPINVTMDADHTAVANCTAEAAGAALEGHVSFGSRGSAPSSRWVEPFVVKLFEPGNLSNVLWSGNATTDENGTFVISDLTPGTYDIGIKNATCLSELETNKTLTAGNTTVVDFGTTREGDCKSPYNDKVDGVDLSTLSFAYNARPGDPNWNPDADLNRSGKVDGIDWSLLSANYDKVGDARGYF